MRTVQGSGLVAAALAGVLACDDVSFPVVPAEEFTATLNGVNENPDVTTAATGTALIAIFNDTILTFRVDVALIDSTTASHIHQGDDTTNGPILVTLFTGPTIAASGCTTAQLTSPRCRVGYSGPLNQGQSKYSALPGTSASFTALGNTARERYDSLLVLMRTGNAYVNVHNRANAGGHIRGQIHPQ